MEKLKAKHDHKLTDIIKVCIFALFLILPLLMFIPSCLYYGFNEHASAPTTQENELIQVDFNQNVYNPRPNSIDGYFAFPVNRVDVEYENNQIKTTINDLTGSNYERGTYYTYNSLDRFLNHKLLLRVYITSSIDTFSIEFGSNYVGTINSNQLSTIIFDCPSVLYNRQVLWYPNSTHNIDDVYYTQYLNYFDLTQMFGAGNEPTITHFNDWYSNNYYDYTLSKIEYIALGQTIEYIDISKNLYYEWKSLWQKPILKWTDNNNFQFTINAFTNVFGITQESYITNYINYLITITAIYSVFDIILTMFKWLTHMIGEK